MARSPQDVSGAGLVVAASIAILGWVVFEYRAIRTLPGPFRWVMVGATSASMVTFFVAGVNGPPGGWVGCGAFGAFLGGLVVGTRGRLDMIIDGQYLPPLAPGETRAGMKRQLAAVGVAIVLLTTYMVGYHAQFFSEE